MGVIVTESFKDVNMNKLLVKVCKQYDLILN